MPSTVSRSPALADSRTKAGSSLPHGGHQEPHRFTTTGRPVAAPAATFRPLPSMQTRAFTPASGLAFGGPETALGQGAKPLPVNDGWAGAGRATPALQPASSRSATAASRLMLRRAPRAHPPVAP